MSNKKKFNITVIILVLLILWNIIVWGNLIYIKYSHTLQPSNDYELLSKPDYPEYIEIDKSIELVNSMFNINYSLSFADLKSIGLLGMAHVTTRQVVIDNTLSGWDILYTLTHELCHIKYYTSNEAYTEYMTFINLYENSNNILHLRGEWVAYEQCTLQLRKNTEYDCSYYILKYLKDKN